MLQNPNWQDVNTTTPLVLTQEDGFNLLQEDTYLILVDGNIYSWFEVSTNQNPNWLVIPANQNPTWQVVT